MDMQITKVCQNAYHHLHNIREIHQFLSKEATCMIIQAFITSQIDDCNRLMNGLPENLMKKLQRVQNTRLVFSLRKYICITPALVTFHWLPVKYRIKFKTLLIAFKGLHCKAPTYIQEMITPPKKQKIFHKIKWSICPEGSKIQAWYYRQACISNVWASGFELIAKGNWIMWLNWSIEAKLKDSSFY